MEYRRSNKRIICYSLIVGLAAMLYGLDLGETTGFLAMTRYNHDFGEYDPHLQTYNIPAGHQTLIYGATLAFAIVAALISGPIGTRYGRRAGLAATALTSIIGPIIQTVARSYAAMVVGRSVAGLGIGFAANFVIPYWTETAPAHLRGLIVVMYQGLVNLSQFVGACINQGTHNMETRWAYRAPLITQLLPPILLIGFLFFIPDTPRWYASRGKNDKALIAMRKLRGPTYSEEELETEVREIVAFVEIERELEGATSYLDCFKGTDLRRTYLTVVSTICQEWSGISFITGYGTYFFTISGVSNPFIQTVITSVCGLSGSACSFLLVKYFGRRPILIVGAAVQGISMLLFAIIGVAEPNSQAAAKSLVAFVSIFIFTYGATWGCVSQVLLGEIPSTPLRSKTVSLATIAGWLCDLLILCGSPYLLSADYANLGTKVGFIFGGAQILVFFWTLFCLPEMKDRTLEQIDEMFLNKVPSLKFKDYITTGEAGGLTVQGELERMEHKGEIDLEQIERKL